MKFDIKDFLDRQNIFYRDKGTGVKKGNVIIHCPYCGADDVNEHLGISLSNGVWGCWRNDSHRNKDLSILISKLIGISYKQARELIGKKSKEINLDLFDELSSDNYFNTNNKIKKQSIIKSLLIPDDFKILSKGHYSKPFINYLSHRGFSKFNRLIRLYDLRYCIVGDYKWRIIFPIYFNKQLVTWTSRTISKKNSLRYLSLNEDLSSINIKNVVYNYDRPNAKGGDVLFIVEGPIDAVKMDFYLRKTDSYAVGLFNMSISDDQLYWLIHLFDKFNTIVLLLDSGELESINKGIAKLNSTGVIINEGELPKGVDDPGELNEHQINNLHRKWRTINYEKS